MPEQNKKRDFARTEYISRKNQGANVNLREFADEIGTKYRTLLNWKRLDDWDAALDPPKRKRGGQPGNQNSKGKKNAAGPHPGAPLQNKNAEKDGAYSTVFLDMLSDEEKRIVDLTPLQSRPALEHEMKILKFREHKILVKIAEYESVPPDTLYTSTLLDMRKPAGKGPNKKDGAVQTIGMYSKDSAFARILKLQEALYKVQGRIVKVADSLRAIEEFELRMQLERERLDILRMRATGLVDAEDDDGPDGLDEIKLEDVK